MSNSNYPWNPFNTLTEGKQTNEEAIVAGGDKFDIIPRYAPFHKSSFVLKDKDSGKELVAGTNFEFILPFTELNESKNVDVVGGVVILDDVSDKSYLISYNPLGEPFILNDADYALLVSNISNSSRKGTWSQVVNLPEGGFPGDPHAHPFSNTEDYDDLITALEASNKAQSNEINNPTVATQLIDHINKAFKLAHSDATKGDFGLDLLKNFGTATEVDLKGNSNELYITLAMCRLLFEKLLKELGLYPNTDQTEPGEGEGGNGELNLNKTLTLGEAINLFLSQDALLSEIKLKGKDHQKAARDNLGLKGGATAEVLNELGDSEVNTVSQKTIKNLVGNLNYDTRSWMYFAEGGELTIEPPYKFSSCLLFLNGLAQPASYSYSMIDNVVTLSEVLNKNDILEFVTDAPIVKRFLYTAKGGETQFDCPYKLINPVLYIEGFEQPYSYAFTNDDGTIYLAGPLEPGERCEVTFDMPLTSQHSLFVDEQLAELKKIVADLDDKFTNLHGIDFLSTDKGNVITTGTDQNIFMGYDALQYITSAEVIVEEN